MADVTGLYLGPPLHATVFSFDEKKAIQAQSSMTKRPCFFAITMMASMSAGLGARVLAPKQYRRL